MTRQPVIRLRLLVGSGACAVLVTLTHRETPLAADVPRLAAAAQAAGLRFAGISIASSRGSRGGPADERLGATESLVDAVSRLLARRVTATAVS